MDTLNRLVLYKAINNVFEVFSTLDHVNDEHSLEIAIILDDIFLERLVSSANSKQQAVSFDFNNESLRSYQEVVVLDPKNWESDLHLINVLRDQFVNWLSRSCLEL